MYFILLITYSYGPCGVLVCILPRPVVADSSPTRDRETFRLCFGVSIHSFWILDLRTYQYLWRLSIAAKLQYGCLRISTVLSDRTSGTPSHDCRAGKLAGS